jgi:Ca2+/Na+ antiporter
VVAVVEAVAAVVVVVAAVMVVVAFNCIILYYIILYYIILYYIILYYKHRRQDHTSLPSPQPHPTGTPHNNNLAMTIA